MTNHNSTLVSGLRMAAIALTVSGAAFAGSVVLPPSPGTIAFTNADADESGGLTVEEYTTTREEGTKANKIARDFKKADIDKSGLLSLDEYRIFIGEIERPTKEQLSFTAADTDPNGAIDLEEFMASLTGKQAPIEGFKRFLKADADESNDLSLEEWTLYKKGKAKGPQGAKYYKFDLADTFLGPADNALTIEEFTLTFPLNTKEATIAKKFAKEDENDSGTLTRDEWNPGAPKQAPAL